MKYLDIFQKVGLTISALILSVGFLIRSFSPVIADTLDRGRYTVDFVVTSSGVDHCYAIKTDTQTGNLYFYRSHQCRRNNWTSDRLDDVLLK